MNYKDIRNIIWFKDGIKEIDQIEIDKCISAMKNDLAVESEHFDFIKSYGSLILCEAFHQYYKDNDIVFFVNYILITNFIAMSNINNIYNINNIFELNNISENQDLNILKNIDNIKKRVRENNLFNEVSLYEFLSKELGEKMIKKEDFDHLMTTMKKNLVKNLLDIYGKISSREHFLKYNDEEKRKIIETMVYYSYINEILCITNHLRTKFLGNIVINDFINHKLFKDYINLLLLSSETREAMATIFMIAPTGENLEKNNRKEIFINSHSVEFDLDAYNKAAIANINKKYKKETFFEKIKRILNFKNILT